MGLRHEFDAIGLTHDVTVEWDRIWIWTLLTVWDIKVIFDNLDEME